MSENCTEKQTTDRCVMPEPVLTTRSVYGRYLTEVCEFYSVDPAKVLSKRRTAAVARARQVLYWLVRTNTKLSWPELGEVFKRDHTTVMQGAKRGEKFAREDGWV